MATSQLEVVNQCLAIMGEAPLNALAEDHAFKAAAINVLDRNDKTIQAKGWWYNSEDLTLTVNPVDGRIYPPTDCLRVNALNERPDLVQRGRTMYSLSKGTDIFDLAFTADVKLIRRVPLEDLPDLMAAYISRKTVLDFQLEYDGDQTKTRNLQAEVYGTPPSAISHGTLGHKGEVMAEHIRNVRVNFIEQSTRFARIRNRIQYSSR